MKLLIDLLGIGGNIAFAWACLPTAYKTFKAKQSIGTPIGLAWNILIACLLFYGYTLLNYTYDPLVWVCGVIEILCYSIVIYYHYLGRK
jgi:uncharacterized protein with PQ loop repeat